MNRRYTFKLYPNKAQAIALQTQAQMCASLWNALLEMRENFYRRARQRGDKKTSLSAFDQGRDITELRAAMPEWAAIPRGTPERVAGDLDLAMKAFFKRLKQLRSDPVLYAARREQFMQRQNRKRAKRIARGDNPGSIIYPTILDLAGYPRFKSVRHADAIPLREPSKSCWNFVARATETAVGGHHSSPAGRGSSASNRAKSFVVQGADCRAPAEAFGNEGGYKRETAWRFNMRGVPGKIRARGRFPMEPLSLRTADLRFYDGAWWLSVCVDLPEAQPRLGDHALKVDFDLIDKFASVMGADGQCVSGLTDPFANGSEGRNILTSEGFGDWSPAEALEIGGASHARPAQAQDHHPAEALEIGGASHGTLRVLHGGGPAEILENEDRRRDVIGNADAIQSERDRRFKFRSFRWRRETARISKLKAREARQRREALHRWTTDIIRQAREIEITAPPIKENTRSGRGNADKHGAEVKTIAMLNRSVLEKAPAAAIAMLEYKAAQFGIPCAVIRKADHQLRVGGELRATAIEGRKARRNIKKEAA